MLLALLRKRWRAGGGRRACALLHSLLLCRGRGGEGGGSGGRLGRVGGGDGGALWGGKQMKASAARCDGSLKLSQTPSKCLQSINPVVGSTETSSKEAWTLCKSKPPHPASVPIRNPPLMQLHPLTMYTALLALRLLKSL